MPLDVDLSIEFAGLRFPNPFVLASAPPTATGDMIKRAFAAGWGGAVCKTLKPDKMEIVDVTPRLAPLRNDRGRLMGLANIELTTRRPLGVWLEEFRDIKQAYPDRVLIASLMAETNREDWQELAVKTQEAGADALELNFSCPHGMPEHGMGAAVGQDADIAATITGWVKEVAGVPVIVKLTPNVTDLVPIVKAAERAGADGFCAINTVLCLIGVDIETFEPLPAVNGLGTLSGYSGRGVKPIGLRCVAQTAMASRLPVSGLGGICSWQDAVEYMLVGARTVQVGTEVMLKGYRVIDGLIAGMRDYLRRHGFRSAGEVVGLTLPKLVPHEALDRNFRVAYRIIPDLCNGCQFCLVSCRDAGYGAIEEGPDGIPRVAEARCDGCSLCQHVCPVHGCVRPYVVTASAG